MVFYGSIIYLGTTVHRLKHGLPSCWAKIQDWIYGNKKVFTPTVEKVTYDRKWANIPILKSYRDAPSDNFWKFFPKCEMPLFPASTADSSQLRQMLKSVGSILTQQQLNRGYRICEDLELGADSFQKTPLPPVKVCNASSAFENGAMLTDKIASWVDSKIVAGPFNSPPVNRFRANPLMAIERNGSVRPVINMSAPLGSSFNDNLNANKLEKVWMSTAQSFGYTVLESGRFSVMSKFDLQNAYKIVPSKISDLRLQGFSWLGKYFVETQQVFGATPSVANFDRLGNTIQKIVTVKSGIPARQVHRTLDDTPVVSPVGSGWCEKFTETYKAVCGKIGVKLAQNCPRNEKAFENVTKGTVLGITFDTSRLEWSYPPRKADDLVRVISDFIISSEATLLQTQKVTGLVNSFAQMCPFVKLFRHPLNRFLSDLHNSVYVTLPVPYQVKADLMVMLRVVEDSRVGLPIPKRPGKESTNALKFVSDAAGSNFECIDGIRTPKNAVGDRGVASIGFTGDSPIWFVCSVTWPLSLLNEACDLKGAYYGSKTTTLEMIGLLLPFLCDPARLAGRDIVLLVDNAPIVYGWETRGTSGDSSASILIRALYLISYWLGVTIFVRHLPRRSNFESILADNLSRKSTTKPSDLRMLRNATHHNPPRVLVDWLENPVEDWSFAVRLLDYVKSIS